MTSEKLSRVIELIKSGDKQAAIPLLKEMLQANPRDENAWLWLYSCVDNVDQKKLCLQKALEINPANQDARNALKRLTELAPAPQAAPARMAAPGVVSKPGAGTRPGRRLALLAVGGAALLLLCGVSFLFLLQTSLFSSFAAGLPFFPSATPTASMTPTFTATATRSPSPTVTSTATRRPSATIPPLPDTPAPTPTIAPFTPGNPTATPLGSDIADPNFKKGLDEYKAEHFVEVIDLMSAVIEANPELVPPYRYRGRAYLYLGDCVSGMADHEKALSIDPDYAQGWAGRGVLNECLGNPNQALSDYQKALSLDPSLAFVHHNLAVHYNKVGNYEKSREEYYLSLAIDPTRSDTGSALGDALVEMGRYEECIEATTKAIRNGWYAYIGRANCELNGSKFSEAINDYKAYLAHERNDSVASYNLGVAYGQRGNRYYADEKYTLAIADYKMAVSLIQGDAHSYCNLSYSYFELKQYKNALEAAKSSIAINPACGGQKLVVVQARSAYALGDYEAAIEYMDRALTMGWYPLGYYYRGISYQAVGKNEEAIQDLKSFLDSDPSGKEADDAKKRLAKLEP